MNYLEEKLNRIVNSRINPAPVEKFDFNSPEMKASRAASLRSQQGSLVMMCSGVFSPKLKNIATILWG